MLIEVLLATTLLTVLAAISWPLMTKYQSTQELQDSASLLASDIRYLQQLSINASATQTYSLFFRTIEPAGYYILCNGNVFKSVRFPGSVQLVFVPTRVAFSKYGVPSSGYTITLRSERLQKLRYVMVEGAIGRVRVSDIK